MRWRQIEQETIEKVNEFLQSDEMEQKRKTREVNQMIVSNAIKGKKIFLGKF